MSKPEIKPGAICRVTGGYKCNIGAYCEAIQHVGVIPRFGRDDMWDVHPLRPMMNRLYGMTTRIGACPTKYLVPITDPDQRYEIEREREQENV
jgi:hypothetical protein